ncbi:MAG: hypothetical protein NDI62_02270 [Burkholderiales bacterium]|nr:hypothetical protein [Burkholderiales bacterium]
MKKKLIGLSSVALSFAPFVASAQMSSGCNSVQPGTIQSIICKVGNILDIIIPILIVLGVVFFVYGVVTFVISDDEEAKTKGRDRMIYGIIGLVVIVAMWGLVGIVKNTFGLTGASTDIPVLAPNF